MNKYLLLIFSIFLLAGSASGQSKKAYRKAADKAYKKGDHLTAYANYRIILDKEARDSVKTNELDVVYRAAKSALWLFEFEIADSLFSVALEHPEADTKADTRFYKGLALYNQTKYESAIELFKEINSTDLDLNQKAIYQIEQAEWALKQKQNRLKLSPTPYKADINTPYVDAAPLWHNGGLYYNSVLNYTPDVNILTYKPISRVHKVDSGQTVGVPVFQRSLEKGVHEANYTVNEKTGREYINLCTVKKNDSLHCQLYYRESETGTFQLMPDYINDDINTVTHPAAGEVDDMGNETVYFVSDREGGKGGLDIWYITLMAGDGKWSQPQNLTQINTSENDITPFYHYLSNTLFFSSNSGLNSMGNFDIYKSQKTLDGNWGAIENIGYPINDGYDNTHFSFNSGVSLATYTSNCTECATSSNEKICKRCDDIFTYEIEVDLNAYPYAVYGGTDTTFLTGTNMTLIDITGGRDSTIGVFENIDSLYSLLRLERQYRIVASKEGWSTATSEFDTKNIFVSKTLIQKLYLRPLYKLEVSVFEKGTNTPINGAKVELTEADGSLVGIETNDTGNEFYFDLAYGKAYSILGSKEEYGEDSETVSVINQESPRVIKRKLYLEKPPLPFASIILYFKNDIPRYTGYNYKQIVTDTSYEETYYRYMAVKEDYASGYAQIETRDVPKDPLKQDVYAFFDTVQMNFKALQLQTENLYQFLNDSRNQSKAVEIQLAGFASPIANNDYNQYLTERRVDCVRNYFKTYKSGAFSQFIGKRLTFKTVAYGESRSDQSVSDSRKDRPRSTYSRKASRLRKVKISNFEIKDYIPGNTSIPIKGNTLLGKRK